MRIAVTSAAPREILPSAEIAANSARPLSIFGGSCPASPTNLDGGLRPVRSPCAVERPAGGNVYIVVREFLVCSRIKSLNW